MVTNPNVLFYLAFSSEQFVGQVRFSRTSELSNECTISISVASDFRGKHLGNKLMASCIEKMFIDWSCVQYVLAEVKHNTVASNMLFQKGGFILEMTVNRYRYPIHISKSSYDLTQRVICRQKKVMIYSSAVSVQCVA